jgi:hypothetical protein
MSTSIISEDFRSQGKIINYNNGKKESVEWKGQFDGNDGFVNIKANNFNGKSISKNIQFTKDTLQDLFNQHISGASLENRLMTDFDLDLDSDLDLSEKLMTFNENINQNQNKNKNKKTKNQNKKNKKRKTRKYKK